MGDSAAELAILISAKDKASGTIDKVGGKLGKFGGVAKIAKLALLGIGVGAIAGAAGLFKIGADFDKAFDTIRIGTGATGEALKDLEGDFKSVFKAIPTDMGSAADAITQFNTLTGATGPALQRMAKNGLEAARLLGEDSTALIGAAGKAFNVFEIGADAASGVLDEVFKASQLSNVPMTKLLSTLQTYGPVLKNLGFGIAKSTAFFASLEKAGIDVSRVMPGLNAFMRKLSDEGVTDLSGALDDQIKKIKGAATESEALNLATQAFGAEGAQRLSVAIRTGALDLADFTKELEASEGGILETAKQTESLGEKFTRFKNKVLVAIEPLATGFFDALSDLATLIEEKFIPIIVDKIIPAFKEWWKEHGPAIVGTLEDAADILNDTLVPALETLVDILLKDVFPAIQKVFNFLRNNKEILAAVGIAIIAVLVPGIISWTVATIANAAAHLALAVATLLAYAPILLLIAAIALLAFGIIKLIQNWDAVVAFITGTVVPLFTNLWATIDEFLGNLPLIGAAWEVVKEVVKDQIDAVIGIVTGVIDIGKEVISFFTNVFKGDWDAAWTDLKEIAVGILNLFLDFLQVTWIGVLKSILESIIPWDWVKDNFNSFVTNVKGKFNEVLNFITGLGKSWGNAAFDLGRDIIEGLKTGVETGLFLVKGVINSLIGIIEGGINFVIQGINNLGNRVNGIIGAIGSVIGFFGGPSLPTIPFIRDVSIPRLQRGAFIPPGVVTPAILHGGRFGEVVAPLDRARGGGRTGTVTINLTINSKFPPSRSELAEEVRLQLPEIERQLALTRS